MEKFFFLFLLADFFPTAFCSPTGLLSVMSSPPSHLAASSTDKAVSSSPLRCGRTEKGEDEGKEGTRNMEEEGGNVLITKQVTRTSSRSGSLKTWFLSFCPSLAAHLDLLLRPKTKGAFCEIKLRAAVSRLQRHKVSQGLGIRRS